MSRCALCPGKYNCVPASGPDCNHYTNPLLFIGEAPGTDEDEKCRPFTGKTGVEVNDTYLPAAGLRRPNIRVDNAISCLPDTSGHKLDPKNKDHLRLLESCAKHHLYPYIERTAPKLIIPMGAFACKAIDPRINLDLNHGIPFETDWGITAFPMWHPAQGIHEPKKMLQIMTDWIRLGKYLAGTLHIPVDEYPNPDYKEATIKDIRDIDPSLDMANDTESSRSLGPYCLTYSQYPGTGRLIRADRRDLLDAYQGKLDQWKARLFWHNWLYDNTVTDEMGLQFPKKFIRDTMIRVFHLGNLPQGLKALCFRELGMAMQDFDDLVMPHSRPHVIEYYRAAYLHDWPKPDPYEYRDKDGELKIKQPQSMKTKLKRFFTELLKNEDKDVFEMWSKNWVDSHVLIEFKCGLWPGKDLAHVPFDEVLHYACRDADGTLRLNPILERMKHNVRRTSQENWRDYGTTGKYSPTYQSQ